MNILWLPSWYPNRLKNYDGDFIQRHAKCTSLLRHIDVIHVVNDPYGNVTSDIKEEVTTNGYLTETIIYYKTLRTGFRFLDRILSSIKYLRVYKEAVQKYVSKNGRPACVHLHVAMRAGLV